MATKWKYHRDAGYLVDEGEIAGTLCGHIIAAGVSPEDGPVIAEAKEMETLLRRHIARHQSALEAMTPKFANPCECCTCAGAGEILDRIDAAKGPVAPC